MHTKEFENILINEKLLNKYNNMTDLLIDNKEKFAIKIILNKNIKILDNNNFNSLKQNELSNIAINIFEEYHINNVFINNGNAIKVTNSGIRESIHKILYNQNQKIFLKEHLLIFSDLGNIIKSAILVGQNYEIKKREHNKVWHYYINGIIIDGKSYLFEFDVISHSDGENHYRVQRLIPK